MEYDSFSKYINGAVKVLWVILNYFSNIKVIQVWNNVKVSKWWQNLIF